MTRFYLLFYLLSCFPAFAVADDILMYIRDDVYENYLQFLGDKDVQSIDNFAGDFIRRDVVDMILIQQALKKGGFELSFRYAAGKVNFRNTQLLQNGKLLLSFDTYWLSDAKALEAYLYISDPVIRRGEYHAGIFASPDHPTIFTIRTLDDLRQYTAVSTPKWRTDWKTLQSLPIKKLFREDEWVSQARMVSVQWVDFFLMPFTSNKQDTYTLGTFTLKHVPNVAVLLDDSRHFVISKKHPYGKQAFEAINRGLAQMRALGIIRKAYQQAGFLIDEKHFNILNKQPSK